MKIVKINNIYYTFSFTTGYSRTHIRNESWMQRAKRNLLKVIEELHDLGLDELAEDIFDTLAY